MPRIASWRCSRSVDSVRRFTVDESDLGSMNERASVNIASLKAYLPNQYPGLRLWFATARIRIRSASSR